MILYGYRSKIRAVTTKNGLEIENFSYSLLRPFLLRCHKFLTAEGIIILVLAETDSSSEYLAHLILFSPIVLPTTSNRYLRNLFFNATQAPLTRSRSDFLSSSVLSSGSKAE